MMLVAVAALATMHGSVVEAVAVTDTSTTDHSLAGVSQAASVPVNGVAASHTPAVVGQSSRCNMRRHRHGVAGRRQAPRAHVTGRVQWTLAVGDASSSDVGRHRTEAAAGGLGRRQQVTIVHRLCVTCQLLLQLSKALLTRLQASSQQSSRIADG
jgi:hypothetical protein